MLVVTARYSSPKKPTKETPNQQKYQAIGGSNTPRRSERSERT